MQRVQHLDLGEIVVRCEESEVVVYRDDRIHRRFSAASISDVRIEPGHRFRNPMIGWLFLMALCGAIFWYVTSGALEHIQHLLDSPFGWRKGRGPFFFLGVFLFLTALAIYLAFNLVRNPIISWLQLHLSSGDVRQFPLRELRFEEEQLTSFRARIMRS